MTVLSTIEDTLERKKNEHKVGQSIDNFSSVWSGIVILESFSKWMGKRCKSGCLLHTSSHQLMVEVTGSQ